MLYRAITLGCVTYPQCRVLYTSIRLCHTQHCTSLHPLGFVSHSSTHFATYTRLCHILIALYFSLYPLGYVTHIITHFATSLGYVTYSMMRFNTSNRLCLIAAHTLLLLYTHSNVLFNTSTRLGPTPLHSSLHPLGYVTASHLVLRMLGHVTHPQHGTCCFIH